MMEDMDEWGKRHCAAFFVTGLFVAALFPIAGQAASTLTPVPGDLFRSETFETVYYMGADGFRYVFPNEKTFFTWYQDFAAVRWTSDDVVSAIQIGGNVTYKPGAKMVKINTDPKTYVVTEGGVLHWVESETIAAAVYGATWNTFIDDLPDAFFTNYTLGTALNDAHTYPLADILAGTFDINADKGLETPAVIRISEDGYAPAEISITASKTVRFINEDDVESTLHSVTGMDLTWGSGTMVLGDEFVHTFKTPGNYLFFDSYDSRYTGTVFVNP